MLKSTQLLQGDSYASRTEKRKLHLQKYIPPKWAENLKKIPEYKINFINSNTPIEEWNIPGLPEGFSLHVKRDDMTGCTITGNKIRKLEFLLADAVANGCSHVITYGAVQSNHCRAVTVAARRLGLTPHLILRTHAKNSSELGCQGNIFIERLLGARIYLTPPPDMKNMTRMEKYETFFKPRLDKLASHIEHKTNEKCYKVAFGGSDEIGLFGIIDLFEEMIKQGIQEDFDDLVVTCASGGLTAGLCLANYLTGSHLKCHGVVTTDNAEYFEEHLSDLLRHVGLCDVRAADLVDMIHGYKDALGQDGLEYLQRVSSTTGILLDPVYTGKSTRAMVLELNNNPTRFKGKRVLFVHAGGMFGMLDGHMDSILNSTDVKLWTNVDDELNIH